MTNDADCAPFASAYQWLTQISQLTIAAVPAGTRGKLHRAIDDLRSSETSSDRIASAGGLSVAVHQFELGARAADMNQIQHAREHIIELAERWRELPVFSVQ